MNNICLPSKKKHRLGFIEKVVINSNLIAVTTTGLKKNVNEDSIGILITKKYTRFSIADGHWGKEASRIIVNYWLNKKIKFPDNSEETKLEIKKIEEKLYKKFGKPNMNEDNDPFISQ